MATKPSTFLTRLCVTQIDAQHWRLTSDLIFQHGDDVIRAPAGFITDFASTPQIVWSLGMPKSGIYDGAAVIHDLIYSCGGLVRYAQAPDGTWTYRYFSKGEADLIFRDAMESLGVSALKRSLMYHAVRLFGRGEFKNPPPQTADGLPEAA